MLVYSVLTCRLTKVTDLFFGTKTGILTVVRTDGPSFFDFVFVASPCFLH